MKVTYIGMYADDGVELHDGLGTTWFEGHKPTDVPREVAELLLDQPVNFEPGDDDAKALLSEIEARRAAVDDEVKAPRARAKKSTSKSDVDDESIGDEKDDAAI